MAAIVEGVGTVAPRLESQRKACAHHAAAVARCERLGARLCVEKVSAGALLSSKHSSLPAKEPRSFRDVRSLSAAAMGL